jgi:nucleoside-diphosphate-sugar epimerase
VNYLRGDSTEIRKTLGWKPIYTFNTMIDEMVDFWESNLK